MTITKLEFSKSKSMPTLFNLKDYLQCVANFYGNVVEGLGGSIWVGIKENQHSLIFFSGSSDAEDHNIQPVINRIKDEVPWVTFTQYTTLRGDGRS